MIIYKVSYTLHLRYIICSTCFLDTRISTYSFTTWRLEPIWLPMENQFYIDTCLPFSLRSALFLFNQLTNVICWSLQYNHDVRHLLLAGPRSSHQLGHYPCMANPALKRLLSHYQFLGVAQSTCRTYQAGVRAFQQFCTHYAIIAFPASPLIPRYFCYYIASWMSYKTIKVYHAGIQLT